jgi:hypothetical protein
MDSLILSSSQISPSKKEFVSPAAPLASKCLLSFSNVQQRSMQAISSDGDASGCTDFGVLSLRRRQTRGDRYAPVPATRRPFQEEVEVEEALFSLCCLLFTDEAYTSASPASRWGRVNPPRCGRCSVVSSLHEGIAGALRVVVVRFTYNGLGTMHTEHDELHKQHSVSKDRYVRYHQPSIIFI